MSPFPLQFVLLLAVATSQIFGGISCCCLGRSLFSPSSEMTHVAVDGIVSASQPEGKAACPKCSARPRNNSVKTPRTQSDGDSAQLCDDGQCRCTKQVSAAGTQNESIAVQSIGYSMIGTVALDLPKFIDQAPVRKFEVPIRFGGRSWQSIACVWKN